MTFLFLTQWLTRWIQELEKKTASYHQTQYSWVAEFSMITERIDTIGNCPGVEPSISTQVLPSLVGQPFSLYCLRPKEGEGDSLFVKILRRHVKCKTCKNGNCVPSHIVPKYGNFYADLFAIHAMFYMSKFMEHFAEL